METPESDLNPLGMLCATDTQSNCLLTSNLLLKQNQPGYSIRIRLQSGPDQCSFLLLLHHQCRMFLSLISHNLVDAPREVMHQSVQVSKTCSDMKVKCMCLHSTATSIRHVWEQCSTILQYWEVHNLKSYHFFLLMIYIVIYSL